MQMQCEVQQTRKNAYRKKFNSRNILCAVYFGALVFGALKIVHNNLDCITQVQRNYWLSVKLITWRNIFADKDVNRSLLLRRLCLACAHWAVNSFAVGFT